MACTAGQGGLTCANQVLSSYLQSNCHGDNYCLIHRRDSFDPSERRMMHRVQIQGEATR